MGGTDELTAPQLLPVEAGNILRRVASYGEISQDVAAHPTPTSSISESRFSPMRSTGGLRHDLTTYDAWYVALAESLEAELATLDPAPSRLHRASTRPVTGVGRWGPLRVEHS
jgi:predicted nucleic acid-binding protein